MLFTNEIFTPQELMRINIDRTMMAINFYKEGHRAFSDEQKDEVYDFVMNMLTDTLAPENLIDMKSLR